MAARCDCSSSLAALAESRPPGEPGEAPVIVTGPVLVTPQDVAALERAFALFALAGFIAGAGVVWTLRFHLERLACRAFGHIHVIGAPGCPRCGAETPEDVQ